MRISPILAPISALLLVLSIRASAAENPVAPLPTPSPDGTRVASVSTFSSADQFRAAIKLVVSDSAGHEVFRSPDLNRNKLGQCTVSRLEWLDTTRVAVLCAYDPQLNDYLVIDLRSGIIAPEYTGLWFRWSPDGRTLARVGVNRLFGTNAGTDSCLYFNDASLYPSGCQFEDEIAVPGSPHHHQHTTFTNIHAFLNPPVWSPDNRRVAFLEKIFDWQYTDPYSRYLDGTASHVRYFLVIAAADQPATGFAIAPVPEGTEPTWDNPARVSVDGQAYDLPFTPIAYHQTRE